MARTGPRKRVLKAKGADVTAAVARATARSEGKPVPPKTKSAIDPEIIPHRKIEEVAAEVVKKITADRKAKARRLRTAGYTRPLGKAVAKMLAMGLSPARIGDRPRMCSATSIYNWIATPGHPFLEFYVRAREAHYQRMAYDIVDIADDSSEDSLLKAGGKDGEVKIGVNREFIERARLRISTRQWLLERVLPHIYSNQADKGADAGHPEIEGPGAMKDITPPGGPQSTGRDHLSGIAERYALKGAQVLRPNGTSSRH
jgi:hypothetical protein